MGRMASEIEGDVKKTLLDRTDAEKVFRPWWDTVEDYLLNILIGLGEHFKIQLSISIHMNKLHNEAFQIV